MVQFLVKGFEVLASLRIFCPNLKRVRTFARAVQRVRTFARPRKNMQRVHTFGSLATSCQNLKNQVTFFHHESSSKFDVKMQIFGRSWVGALLVQFLVKGFEVLAWLRTLCPNIGRVRTFARAVHFRTSRGDPKHCRRSLRAPVEAQNTTSVVSERPSEIQLRKTRPAYGK